MRGSFLMVMTIFTGLLLAAAPDALSQQALTARVMSLDPNQSIMVVAPVSTDGYPDRIKVYYNLDQAPAKLTQGDVIRIQGNWSSDNRTQFSASHIGYGRNAADPTGVRSRIGKCRGHGHRDGKHRGRSW